jgi:NAD(P)H-dependent FMN reductase
MTNIAVILGSTRPGRFAEKPGRWILDEVKKRKGVTAELLDLRDYPMPYYDQPASPAWLPDGFGPDVVKAWTRKIAEADGFIIIAPEYNRGYTAVLKNALDWVYKEWNNKPVGFVAYGGVGGARSVEQLRLVSIELQLAPVRQAVHLPVDLYLALRDVDAPEASRFAPAQQQADTMLDQLLTWTEAFKGVRAKLQETKKAA